MVACLIPANHMCTGTNAILRDTLGVSSILLHLAGKYPTLLKPAYSMGIPFLVQKIHIDHRIHSKKNPKFSPIK